jgi:hypothetical protein
VNFDCSYDQKPPIWEKSRLDPPLDALIIEKDCDGRMKMTEKKFEKWEYFLFFVFVFDIIYNSISQKEKK